MIALRDEHPVFRRTTFFAGEPDENGLADVFWFRPDGRRMARREWDARGSGRLGVFINGNTLRTVTPDGQPLHDDSFLVIFNAHHEPTRFVLPTRRFGRRWEVVVSTVIDGAATPEGAQLAARAELTAEPRSLLVLKRV